MPSDNAQENKKATTSPTASLQAYLQYLRDPYKNRNNFIKGIKEFLGLSEKIMKQLKASSVEEANQFEYYLKPYRALSLIELADPGEGAEPGAQLQAFLDSIVEADTLALKPEFKEILDLMTEATLNHVYLSALLIKAKDSGVIRGDVDYIKKIGEIGNLLILPTQTMARFELLLKSLADQFDEKHLNDPVMNEKLLDVMGRVKAAVSKRNDDIKVYSNAGKAFLLSSSVEPDLSNITAFLAAAENSNNNYLGIKAAYLRVTDGKGGAKLYYLNQDDKEAKLVLESSKSAKAAKVFEDLDALLKQMAQNNKVVEELTPEIKAALAKIANHSHKVVDTQEKEVQRRYRHSLMNFMTETELNDLVMELSSYLAPQKQSQTSLHELLNQLRAVQGAACTDEERMSAVRQLIMMPYLNIYVEERGRGYLYGTAKGPNLYFMENLLQKYYLLEVGELDHKSKEDKVDARIIKSLGSMQQILRAAVKHLFIRAMAEGLGGARKELVYTNARKIINRMGAPAIQEWNRLVDEKFNQQAPAELKMTVGKLESETKDIVPTYTKLSNNKKFMEHLNKACEVEILAAAFVEAGENFRLVSKLEGLAQQADEKADNLEVLVHQAVMEAFIDAHLKDEGGLNMFDNSRLKNMISALHHFHQQTGSKLFGTYLKDSGFQQVDKKILHSVDGYLNESQEFARKIFEHALKSGFGGLGAKVANSEAIEKRKREAYVKAVQTVIDMGEPAIKAWNQLALQFNNPLIWANLIIQNSNRQPQRFEKLHTALVKNSDFMSELKTRPASNPYEYEPSKSRLSSSGASSGRQH